VFQRIDGQQMTINYFFNRYYLNMEKADKDEVNGQMWAKVQYSFFEMKFLPLFLLGYD